MRPNVLTLAIALAPNSLNIENEERFQSEVLASRVRAAVNHSVSYRPWRQ
jgi:hypothetical protein